MNVRFFYQHFWPDSPPYATMLRTIGAHLAQEGHTVRIVTAQPSYKASDRAVKVAPSERLDGIEVQRLPGLPGAMRSNAVRALQKVLFPVRAAFHVVRRRVSGERDDVIVAATIPPVINGVCAWAAARLTGTRYVYHLQDIYPEIGAVGGLWSADSIRHRLLRAIDTFVCGRAARCIVLSVDMRDALLERGLDGDNIVIVNNVMLDAHGAGGISSPVHDSTPVAGGAVRRIVFAGNLGRFQGLELVLEAFIAYRAGVPVDGKPVELHFLGDGAAREGLRVQANDHPAVHFHDHLPFGQAAAFIAACDAGVVSIAPEVFRYAYPSKTMTYLGLGVPLFAVVESESALAGEIRKHRLGVVAGRDREEMAAAFEQLARWLDSPAASRDRLLAHYRQNASTESVLASWSKLANGLSSPAERVTPA